MIGGDDVAELESIIESVMSSPESMGRIMDIVKLFGDVGEQKTPPEDESAIKTPPADAQGFGFDPALLSKIMNLVGSYNADDDRRIRLLGAIRPYLKDSDSYHIDRAIQIVKLSRVAKSVLRDFLK